MIKRIVSNDAFHDKYVSEYIDLLQTTGFEVNQTVKRSKCWGIFGNDITDILYDKISD